ncbi:hypothetical protein M8C21_033544 [Ambrosia artemisiifolia]|uniref:Uncharacterized protein n=1 Tax=Ambrosia artemisiifolia TaxID=4212 RepID=A0AAD5D771_AMBAR|nr:hypothetical protein M8C21_033544 [Ambrosia artemisiifolia]
MAFFMSLVAFFRSTMTRLTKKLHDVHVTFEETKVVSSVLERLGELENKVDTLKAKPSEMPYEKVALLNAAGFPIDALKAELIVTKKALHEALMRQEELLAYIDTQEEKMMRKKKFCW